MEASGNFTSVAGSAAALADEASAHTFPAAVLVAMAVVTTDTVPLLPTQPVAVFAGAALGFTKALAAVVAGQAVATVLALCIGRYWLARGAAAEATVEASWEGRMERPGASLTRWRRGG